MNVQAPDGSVIQFPDGTDPSIVDQTMRQNFMPSGAITKPSNAPGVLTDDGTVWPQDQTSAPSPSSPGLIQTVGNAVMHPQQTMQDAWNYPGSYIEDAVKGQLAAGKSAATLPGDVATGKVDMNDPAQASSNAARVLGAAMLEGPMRASGEGGAFIKAAPPTTASTYAAGSQGFDNWVNSGLQYDPTDVGLWALQKQQGLLKDGILPVTAGAPSTHSILDNLANPPPNAAPLSAGDMDAIRKSFLNTAQGSGANNTERMAATQTKNDFLNYLQNGTPVNVPSASVAGPTAAAAGSDAVGGLRDAISNWHVASKADLLDNIGSNAELRNEVSNSGQGGGNPLRQNVAAALRLNPSTGTNLLSRSGFSPDEISAVRAAIPGGPVRTASNLTGGGLGHAGMIGGLLAAKEGYEAGGVPGAIAGGSLPFIGTALRNLDQNTVASRLAAASDQIRSASPLAQSGAISGVSQGSYPLIANRLARALVAAQGNQQSNPNQ